LGVNDPTDDETTQLIKRFQVNDLQTMLFSARGAGPNSKQRG
jgi:hypothetical protein